MDISVDQLIAALASPPGGAARGIVRISGNDVREILSGWFDPVDVARWSSSKRAEAHSGSLRLNSGIRKLAVPVHVLDWPNRRSYTGQPLIELHLPGSPSLLEAVLGEIYRRGARPARPGEFTLRAFLAGKLDLLQAEAVLGVIDARDHTELQTALAQLAGGISSQLGLLRRDLLELLADLEAGLDFIEEDIEFVSRAAVIERLEVARKQIGELLTRSADRMQSRVRPLVVLAGLPNAGKSTLFNRLVGANTALVSPVHGTTRDFLIRTVSFGGISFDLIDTAGWDNDATGIEAAAQKQRSSQLHRADVLVWCSSATLNNPDREIDRGLFEGSQSEAPATIHLLTKADLDSRRDETTIPVSVLSGSGFDEFEVQLRRLLGSPRGRGNQWLGMTAARCRETLESASTSLERSSSAARLDQLGDELIAVDLREAIDHLGAILGTIYTDDILDRVFSKFCIGK